MMRSRSPAIRTLIIAVSLSAAISALIGAQATRPEARLKAAGIDLPAAQKSLANYVPTVRTGDLVFVSGQGPLADGKPMMTGKVGADVSEEDGYKAAKLAVLNSLAALRAEIGSLDRVRRVVKVTVWVNSAPGFTRQSAVANGASDLLVQIFGEAGRHARAAIGANELPLNIPVEVEMVVEVARGSAERR